jgi:hypothetical protein
MNSIKKIVQFLVEGARSVLFRKKSHTTIYLVARGADAGKVAEVQRRLQFFESGLNVEVVNNISLLQYFDYSLLGFVSWRPVFKKFLLTRVKHVQVYNFDYDSNYGDGWEYHRLLSHLRAAEVVDGVRHGKEVMQQAYSALKDKFEKAYVFGTGPSLERAAERDWSDGLRIVCNTIVKDEKLWHHIEPHFIVAADAIYHFGIGNFASNFRRDVANRLRESPDTLFVFPAEFYVFCLRELREFSERLVPIPVGGVQNSHDGFIKSFALPAVGNVLPSMLLPLACTFSKNIFLWGFDGRAPGDKMFWKNSDRHFYSADVEQLTKLHPAFFNFHVPKGKEDNYVRKVHGTALEELLRAAEQKGFSFTMMHFSYTEVLQKRNKNK